MRLRFYRRHKGISLLEVVVCTFIVTGMMVLTTDVIRQTVRTIGKSHQPDSMRVQLQGSLTRLARLVREGTVHGRDDRSLKLELNDPDRSIVEVTGRRKDLVMIYEIGDIVTLAENIGDYSFEPVWRFSSDRFPLDSTDKQIGIKITLVGVDEATGVKVLESFSVIQPSSIPLFEHLQ